MSHTVPQAGHHTHHDNKQHGNILLGSSLEFRDEQIYLRSIAPHVQLIRKDVGEGEIIQIQWGKVLWITIKDHVITPLIRGLVWGIAGQYVGQITALFLGSKSQTQPLKQGKEGKGVSWLRRTFAGLMSGVKATAVSPSH